MNVTNYEPFVRKLEELVNELENEFPKPVVIQHGKGLAFRHKPEVRGDILASFLKLVRVVSLLNSSLLLMEKGFTQEVGIFCRAIDEAIEDISFFAIPIGENGTSDNQMKLLKEFYQEQFENPNVFSSSLPRDRVPRKKISAAIGNFPIKDVDPNTINTIAKSLREVFSGYVHGAYVHIMEMYDGGVSKYQMKGMPDSPYMDACVDNFANSLYRSFCALGIVASRVKRQDIFSDSVKLCSELAKITGCVDEESIKKLEQIRNTKAVAV